jgi:hypothetical protein
MPNAPLGSPPILGDHRLSYEGLVRLVPYTLPSSAFLRSVTLCHTLISNPAQLPLGVQYKIVMLSPTDRGLFWILKASNSDMASSGQTILLSQHTSISPKIYTEYIKNDKRYRILSFATIGEEMSEESEVTKGKVLDPRYTESH